MKNKEYSFEEKVWFDLKELFEEELNQTYHEPWTKKDKVEFIKSLGYHYDNQFCKQLEIDIEEWVKQNPSFHTFSNLARKELGEKLKSTPIQRHELKMSKFLIQDKGLSFSLLELIHGRTEIKGLTYKTWQILDCIGHSILEKYGFLRNVFLPTKDGDKRLIPQSEEELNGVLKLFDKMRKKDPDKYEESSFRVRLSSLEIRKKLNREHNLRNDQVHQEIKNNLAGGLIITESPTFYIEEIKKAITYGEMDNICKVRYIKIEDRKKHSPETKYYYEFIFDQSKVGLILFSNLLLGWYKFLPEKTIFYSELSGGAQMIYRAINSISKKEINVPLTGLIKLCQLKDEKKRQAKKTIEKFLDELKKHKLIQNWVGESYYKKHDKIYYKIFK